MEILAGTMKIPNAICECISIFLSAAAPVVLLLFIKKRSRENLRPVCLGAVAFIVSVFVLEQILHFFVLMQENPLSVFINGNVWAYCLYGGLAAGIFEETARFVVFRKFLKNNRSPATPLLYAVGHGGIESLLVGTMAMASVFVMALNLNASGSAVVFAEMPPEFVPSLFAVYQPLFDGSPLVLLAGGAERVSAVMLHIALSIVVYVAATQKKRRYLYPLAVLCHAVADIPAALFQKHVLTDILAFELLFFAAAALFLVLAVRLVYPLAAAADSEQ